MNGVDLLARLARSRQMLGVWSHEASLPWANRDMTRGICETEITALKGFRNDTEEERLVIDGLIHDWDVLRLQLV